MKKAGAIAIAPAFFCQLVAAYTTGLQPVVLQFPATNNYPEPLRHHQALAGGSSIS